MATRQVLPYLRMDSTHQPESNLQAIQSGLRSAAQVRLCRSRCLNSSDTSRRLGFDQFVHMTNGGVSRLLRLGPDSPWTVRMLFRGRASPVLEVGALSDLDNVSVRIADVAANLAVLGNRFREELGSSTFPQFVARSNIRNAEIHKAVDVIRVGDAERHRRLIRGRPAPNVENHPDIRKLKVRRSVAVAHG